ncbi:MAG: hypothetical protein CL728_03470 [Chloroflexi bacterium]|nr:hypothetical protein [Chloroflexota bacterium]|tara:strand:- start:321 stop:1073 length:753 start_codon:yes stop_codon:yes gene_type:complete
MEEEEETSSGKFEWSGSFNISTYELENIADNSEYDYTGNEAFEIMDFESEIRVVYIQDDTPSGGSSFQTFSPDFLTYSFVLDGIVPPNLVFISEIDEQTGVFKIKIGGDVGFLKDYAPEFLLPENFTYDKYDSPDGFYQQGSKLIEAGGNYQIIVDQPRVYEIEFSITVSLSDGDPDDETTTTKETTKTFKIIINRNFSAMRNQFMAGYLDEQIARGENDFFTYKGTKYFNSNDYINALVADLTDWKFSF